MEGFTNETFITFADDLCNHFDKMSTQTLFQVDVDVEELWNIYLDAFPEEMQTNYKTARWQDCSACHKWFKKMANVVALDDEGKMTDIFSFETLSQYQPIVDKLHNALKDSLIKEAFFSSKDRIGAEPDFIEDEVTGKIERHDHFYTNISDRYVKEGIYVGREKGRKLTNKLLLERSLKEITPEAIDTVLSLIEENNLYRGAEWKNQLEKFKSLQEAYSLVDDSEKNNWLWLRSYQVGTIISGLKNHSIGVLLKDISEDVELDVAIGKYEKIVAPEFYQRPKPIFTKKMLEEAKQKITDLGYLDSLSRRYAVAEDVSVNDVLFINRNLISGFKDDDDDLFAQLEKDAISVQDNTYFTEAIDIRTFIEEVIPSATEISLLTEAKLEGNFVSLIAPVNKDAPSMFKWDNSFGWAYKNNTADSMREQVKIFGGDVDVDLRFTIRWNTMTWDKNDLDAHCTQPDKEEIYFGAMRNHKTGGWLDVDIIDPQKGIPAIENIQFKTREQMDYGDYLFRVHQYNYRGGDEGFEAEIEFDGMIYSFNYPYKVLPNQYVDVAKVTLNKDSSFSIEKLLDGAEHNRSVWNVKLNEFVPVTFVCYSPNFWDNDIGNKQVFFMLKDCINDGRPNAWYNEYLNSELIENRKVMEALGSKAKVEESDNQLSGIGFSLTKSNRFTAKVTIDNTEKIYKVII